MHGYIYITFINWSSKRVENGYNITKYTVYIYPTQFTSRDNSRCTSFSWILHLLLPSFQAGSWNKLHIKTVVSKYIREPRHSVPVHTCTSWHSPQQTPTDGGHKFFLFFFYYYHLQEDTPLHHTAILKIQKLYVSLICWRFYYEFCSVFVHVY